MGSNPMLVPPRHFVRFLDGRAGPFVTVGFVPGNLSGHLGTIQTGLRLRRDYAHKLINEHEVNFYDFKHIQETIDRGHCQVVEAMRLQFLYVRDQSREEIYNLVIKVDATRQELWLVTFYRMRKKQFFAKLRPRALIRIHLDDAEEIEG